MKAPAHCEHFVSGMEASGVAALIGRPTTGACGWSRNIELPGGATLWCSLTFPFHGKEPSPLHGIPTHICWCCRRAGGAAGREGRDSASGYRLSAFRKTATAEGIEAPSLKERSVSQKSPLKEHLPGDSLLPGVGRRPHGNRPCPFWDGGGRHLYRQAPKQKSRYTVATPAR